MSPDSDDLAPAEVPLSDEDRRLVASWAVDCAERALPLFEAKAPGDTRPREAIEGTRAFAVGGKRTARLRTLAWAALAAGREVGDPVATAAARAASAAAGTPYIHALATPHQANHIHGPALYQAQARELAAGGDPDVGDEEIRWAIEHASPALREVVRRFPAGRPSRSRLGLLKHQLDTGLRRGPASSGKAKYPLQRAAEPSPHRRPVDGRRDRGERGAHRDPVRVAPYDSVKP
ncbi:putative immunity protein [Actinosynnema sp. CS-041913]|uniref:putative immunity protein n=1 Tax=Actinosynnema sp. CS-041913 TaxID=3239917 RepID=UPI003D8CDC4D